MFSGASQFTGCELATKSFNLSGTNYVLMIVKEGISIGIDTLIEYANLVD